VGDQILSLICQRLKQNLRQFDMVGRWGGDEFLILLREVTGETITKVVRKIEVFLNEEQYITEGGQLSVNCSLGVGVIEQNESLIDFLNRADEAMYADKKTKL
jgi:diguanylate cyclase (GGDEF)-like protein